MIFGDDIPAGTRVYKAYTPQAPGIVVGSELVNCGHPNSKDREWQHTIRWLNPKKGQTVERWGTIHPFDKLIEDHEKKLRTHRKIRKRLVTLAKEIGTPCQI